MSAFLCSPEHLAALVDYAQQYDGTHYGHQLMQSDDPRRVTDADFTFAALLCENLKSLGARYGERSLGDWYSGNAADYSYGAYSRRSKTWNPIQIIKLAHCYEYQACEHEGWATSDVKRWLDKLEAKAIRNLPGYDEAPWGL